MQSLIIYLISKTFLYEGLNESSPIISLLMITNFFLVLINQYHVLDRPSFKVSRHNYYTANLKIILQNYGFALFSGNFI